MHEMALTRSVLDIAVEEAERAGAREIRSIRMTVGYARDMVEELFEKCFVYLSRNTIAEHAELVLHRTPIVVHCDACGMPYHMDLSADQVRPCPLCGTEDYDVVSGLEFQIDEIEVA